MNIESHTHVEHAHERQDCNNLRDCSFSLLSFFTGMRVDHLKHNMRRRIPLTMHIAGSAGNTLHARSTASVVASLASLLIFASTASAGPTAVTAVVNITFTGSSSLHDFEGKAPVVRASLHESSTPRRWDGDFVIPVAGLETGNSARDARMREMFSAERWPEIRVKFQQADSDVVQRTGVLPVQLTIANTTRDIPVSIANWKAHGNEVSFDAHADVSLAAFHLEAPSVLGLVRVADNVKIDSKVQLQLKGDEAAGVKPMAGVPAEGVSP